MSVDLLVDRSTPIFQPESSLKWMRDVLIILIGAMFGLEYTNIHMLAKPSVA